MKQLLLTILFITFVLPLTAQSAGEMVTRPPKYEVRAPWVTAVYGLTGPVPVPPVLKASENKRQN